MVKPAFLSLVPSAEVPVLNFFKPGFLHVSPVPVLLNSLPTMRCFEPIRLLLSGHAVCGLRMHFKNPQACKPLGFPTGLWGLPCGRVTWPPAKGARGLHYVLPSPPLSPLRSPFTFLASLPPKPSTPSLPGWLNSLSLSKSWGLKMPQGKQVTDLSFSAAVIQFCKLF